MRGFAMPSRSMTTLRICSRILRIHRWPTPRFTPTMDSSRIGRALPTLGVIALSVALLYVGLLVLDRLKAVVLILLGAVFLAYLLYPMIRFLQSRRFPRWLAILTVYVVLGLVVAAAVSYGGPPIAAQARTFSMALPSIVHQVHDGLVKDRKSVV